MNAVEWLVFLAVIDLAHRAEAHPDTVYVNYSLAHAVNDVVIYGIRCGLGR